MSLVLVIGFEVVELDAALRESYQTTSVLTSEPIEDGYSIADHIRHEPPTIQIDGLHSNKPPIIGLSLRESPVRAESLDETLVEAQENGTEIDVLASLRWLTGYIITSYNPVRDSEFGDALRFTMTLQKLETVRSQLLGDIPIPDPPAAYPPFLAGLLAKRIAEAAASTAVVLALISWGATSS